WRARARLLAGGVGRLGIGGAGLALGQARLAAGTRFGQRAGLGLLLQFHTHADVAFGALSCQFDLALALGETLLLLFRVLVVAVRAAHSLDEVFRGLVFLAERLAAGAAELVFARHQAVAHRHPFIEDETI